MKSPSKAESNKSKKSIRTIIEAGKFVEMTSAMAATTIDKQINTYLELLNLRQKKALLTVAKTFAEEQNDNGYNDEFKAELDSRYEDYKHGGNVISEQEVNRRIDKIIKGIEKREKNHEFS